MRRLVIYCDGGFGNRFNALVSGLVTARTLGLEPLVVWPVNNWCGAAYGELFDAPQPVVVDRELATFMPERDRYRWFIVEDRLGLAHQWTSPLHLRSWDEVRAFAAAGGSDDVFYYTALIPPYVDGPALREQVRALKLRPEITGRAQAFLRDAGLVPGDYLGVQIRKTDFGANGADDDNLYQLLAKVPQRRAFVCSDDKTVEQRFAALPNVAIHAKQAHVEKLVDGQWTTVTTDHSGRAYPCNVNRSGQSVIDAVVDLLVLSHAQIVKTSNSTFLQTAMLLQACR